MKQQSRKATLFTVVTVAIIALSSISAALFAANDGPSVRSLMKQLDNLGDMNVDVTATMKMVQMKSQGTKVYRSKFYRSDKRDSFLLVMLAPPADKGKGYLRTADGNMFMMTRTMALQGKEPSHLKADDTISGTDMKAGDLKKRTLEDDFVPTTEKAEKAMLGKLPVYKFTLKAKPRADVTYPRVTYYVSRTTTLPKKVENYSLSGTLMNISYYKSYTKIKGKYFLKKGTFIDKFEGDKTLMDMESISVKNLPASTFTKGFLKTQCK